MHIKTIGDVGSDWDVFLMYIYKKSGLKVET